MSWDAAYTIRDEVVAKFSGSAFEAALAAYNTAKGTSAPQTASDARSDSGKAVYTIPTTTYAFPCVEITPPEGSIEWDGSSTTSEVSLWVYVSFRGTEDDLDDWAPAYLTALVRTFLTDASGSSTTWAPVEFTASPLGATAEGTFVQAVGCKVVATVAEAV